VIEESWGNTQGRCWKQYFWGHVEKDLLSFLHRKVEGEATISLVKAGCKLHGDAPWKENWKKISQNGCHSNCSVL